MVVVVFDVFLSSSRKDFKHMFVVTFLGRGCFLVLRMCVLCLWSQYWARRSKVRIPLCFKVVANVCHGACWRNKSYSNGVR